MERSTIKLLKKRGNTDAEIARNGITKKSEKTSNKAAVQGPDKGGNTMDTKGKVIVGQACTVTKGPNKGKKGTYTRDSEGRIWCEGDWGATECGSDRCSAGKAQVSVFDYVDANGTLVHEIDGLFDVEGLGIFQCNAIIDAATGEGRKISAIPIAATSLTALRKSESEIERRAADVIESHLRGKSGPFFLHRC